MLRRTSFCIILGVLVLLSCDTSNSIDPVFEQYFIKYYGEDGDQTGVDLLVGADGSMILLGNSSPSQLNAQVYPFLVKVDPFGDVLWLRRLGGGNEVAVDVEFDRAGNLMVVSNVGDEPNSRIRLFKVGTGGNTLDSVLIEMGEKQVARSVTQISDDSYLIAGYAEPKVARNPVLPSSPPDEADLIVIQVDPMLDTYSVKSDLGGGEHVGATAKVFETNINGSPAYFLFGDSDRLYDGVYKRSFEAIGMNAIGRPNGIRQVVGKAGEVQTVSTAIETQGALLDGYLMVGTTFTTNSSNVYYAQFDKTLSTKRLDKELDISSLNVTNRLEGISGAIGPQDFYILANEITANNKRNIVLIKLDSDGNVLGSIKFGTLAGDDIAGAVAVLPDRRAAVLGTIELETQQKMSLMLISPDGKFSP